MCNRLSSSSSSHGCGRDGSVLGTTLWLPRGAFDSSTVLPSRLPRVAPLQQHLDSPRADIISKPTQVGSPHAPRTDLPRIRPTHELVPSVAPASWDLTPLQSSCGEAVPRPDDTMIHEEALD